MNTMSNTSNTMSLKLVLLHSLFLSSLFLTIHALFEDIPNHANLSNTWTVRPGARFTDGSYLLPIIVNTSTELNLKPTIGFGFYSKLDYSKSGEIIEAYSLVIFAIAASADTYTYQERAKVLWTANRYKPVRNLATVELTSMGDLVLREANGTLVWSTNTTGKGVVGMKIFGTGDLVLYSKNKTTVWSSFDHPTLTDTWLPSQMLVSGQRIIADVSDVSTPRVELSVTDTGLYAFINSSPPQMYSEVLDGGRKSFKNGLLYIVPTEEGSPLTVNYTSDRPDEFHYIRLDSDGHLRAYQWSDAYETTEDDILTGSSGECAYPAVCGKYGICSSGQCSCPIGADGDASYFRHLDYSTPNLGCKETTPFSCNSSTPHLLELQDVSYFNFDVAMVNTDVENCKLACLQNCFCKAVFFRNYGNSRTGNCSLPSQLFSLMASRDDTLISYHSTAFLKVQGHSTALSPSPRAVPNNVPTQTSRKNARRKVIILASTLGTTFVVFLLFTICFLLYRKRLGLGIREDLLYEDGESNLAQASGMPQRFSYNALKAATGNFQKRIGGGGFGSVYEGILHDGTIVAVKRLDNLGQGKKEFFAEVKTIGSIHHVNLVKLIGFCVEKSSKLLVYEYMCKGSLDKWIFPTDHGVTFDWKTRRKIILDIAMGLSYLHEECHKRIVHLDIKPQNILLDADFNVKISDFGLAKLIDKDQSQVLTRIRGTRGYLAPEWLLNNRISEKVDVYSFGIVVLEIMCGRKNLDYSQHDENECLLHLVKRKAEDNQLFDIVDQQNEDMKNHKEEAVKMIRTAIWCLQGDSTRRPSMSNVVKVLEGGMDMDDISDYGFLTLIPVDMPRDAGASNSTPQVASVLSGPR